MFFFQHQLHSNKTTKSVSNYYFFQDQSLFKYLEKEDKRVLLVTFPPLYHVDEITISPSKNYILFSAIHYGKKILFITDADGSNLQRIIEGNDIYFKWSPIEDKVGIIQDNDEQSFFYLYDLNSTAKLIAEAHHFSWSPNSKYLILHKAIDQGNENYILHRDGSGLRFIIEGDFLEWSNDGNYFYINRINGDSHMVNVFSYDGNIKDERLFSKESTIKVRNNQYENASLFSYLIEGAYHHAWYYPSLNDWKPINYQHVKDFHRVYISNAVYIDIFIQQNNGFDELLYVNSNESISMINGHEIQIISISPDESRFICKVSSEFQSMYYYLDPAQKTIDLVSHGTESPQIFWHPNSEIVALNIDENLIILTSVATTTLHRQQEIRFVSWFSR